MRCARLRHLNHNFVTAWPAIARRGQRLRDYVQALELQRAPEMGSRASRRIAVLLIALPVWVVQTAVPPSVPAGPQPVKNVAEPPKASAISLDSFEFQQPTFLHAGPGFADLEGEPVIGTETAVEAYLFGDEAIATVRFEAVDENGTVIAPVVIARAPYGSSRFVGLMTVPPHPFRIAISGEAVDGQPYRRVHKRPFRPIDRADARAQSWPGMTPEWATLIRRSIDEAGPTLMANLRTHLATAAKGTIVMPRTHIGNVMYAPLFSAQGRPIGLRITYQARFSEKGQYEAGLGVEAVYSAAVRRGLSRMTVLDSTISPMPREPYPPYDEIVLNDIRTSPLDAGAHYTYEADTVYRFSADLVPNFVFHNLDRTKSCIYHQAYNHSPDTLKSTAQILANEVPTTYSVMLSGFRGRIQNFYAEGTFLKSFVAEGASDCGPNPTRRF